MHNDIDTTSNRAVFFYVDESYIEIDGKKHHVFGAIRPYDIGEMALKTIQLKMDLDLDPLCEIKWNMTGIDGNLRYAISDGIAAILNGSAEGMISIIEEKSKQRAGQMLCKQIVDYCASEDIPAFVMYMDNDLVPSISELYRFANNLPCSPKCIGMQMFDSSYDQLIQCCDIFIGLFCLRIRLAIANNQKPINFMDESINEEVECCLSDYEMMLTRYILWRVYEENYPIKKSMGTGIRIDSSISEDVIKIIESEVATNYMGCLH